MEQCLFYNDGGCTCDHPFVIVADAILEIPSFEVRTSVPVCIAHATRASELEQFTQRLAPHSKPVQVHIIPREPYRSYLRELGVKLG